MISRDDWLHELRPYVERARQIEGWTFAFEPVPLGPPPPWDYLARARELLPGARSVLDMGTGGGERFAELLIGFSGRAVATEGWAPNVSVAARRLRPLGAAVVFALNLTVPFAGETFELILNRHEDLDPADVARVLRPGGAVLTQQCHSDDHAELRAFFPRMTIWEPHHETYPRGFEAAGLRLVDVREHSRPVTYQHLGEIVYLLEVAPWTVPDFDIESDLEALIALDRDLRGPEGIVLSERRYIVEAYKPG